MAFDGHGLFFDFGTNYKKLGKYYQDFLQPRSNRGLHDYLEMGLIPRIKCYREDIRPADVDLSAALDLKVDALFISHAHLDHIGHAGFLELSIPFVTTPMTAAIMKAMKDCGQRGAESECVYAQLKARQDTEGRVIQTPRMKKGQRYATRDFILTEAPTAELEDFWNDSVTSYDIESREFLDNDFLDFECRAYAVDHSMYGACAHAVETPVGWVVYTGDLRRHGKGRESTDRFVKKARALNPAVLIIEGTTTSREESKVNLSEATVKETCAAAVEAEDDLIIADFSPRNFERLDTFLEIAKESGRSLVITKKDAYYLRSIRCVDGIDRMKELSVYGQLKTRETGMEEAACDCENLRVLDPREIAAAPASYILCFSLGDLSNLLDIKHKGGTYIYSSSEAYSEEQVIDFQRLYNWLRLFRLEVKGFSMAEVEGKWLPQFDHNYHASGHASKEDLRAIIDGISPEKVLPVHTEDKDFFKSVWGNRVIDAKDGVQIDL